MGYNQMKQKPPTPTIMTTVLSLSGMGFTIAVPIVLGVLLGHWLDSLLHTNVVFLLLGLLLGLIAGIGGAFRLYKAVFKS